MSSLLTEGRAEWDFICPSCSVVQPGSRLRDALWLDFLCRPPFPLAFVLSCPSLPPPFWTCVSLLPGLLLIPDPTPPPHPQPHPRCFHHSIDAVGALSSFCTLCINPTWEQNIGAPAQLHEAIRKSRHTLHMLLPSPSAGTSGPCF